MGYLIDEMGNRYGRLIVVRRARNSSAGQARWVCQCDCGNEIVVFGQNLRRDYTKSCGCWRREFTAATNHARALPKGEASLNAIIRSAQRGAKKRGLVWGLTKEQVRIITQQRCWYCGKEPAQTARYPRNNGNYVYNGLDRKNNAKGYLIDNVVPCCWTCNNAKRAMRIEEFHAWVCRIYMHFGKRNRELQCS